jgi:nucleotide-binding universal stress UspA family protein/uncharacterized ParB-like nuclease family protein
VGTVDNLVFASAVRDFQNARRKAAMQDIVATLTGKSDKLLSYEEIASLLKVEGSTRRGLQEIPLDAIVGSVGRYADFTRTFLPRRQGDQERWAHIKLKTLYHGGLPPIEVYKVGETYFVLDGNHRVSVARELGATTIQAYVTEVQTKVPLEPDVRPDDLIIKARYAEFLELTGLDRARPQADFGVTAPGQYRHLEEEIARHGYRLEQERGREVRIEEAAADWYDSVYRPVATVIGGGGILADFPGRTVTDLYVWVSRHRAELAEEMGWQVNPALAASDLTDRYGRSRRRVVSRWGRRLRQAVTPEHLQPGPAPGDWREHVTAMPDRSLFTHVLVPISGQPEGWFALDQALIVAQREATEVHGLHVVPAHADRDSEAVQSLSAEFQRRTELAGVSATLHVDTGRIARAICRRAQWTDLVVVKLTYPPGETPAKKLASGFRSLIQRCSRPVLAVPGEPSSMERALLAYDGSPKADEALYLATYLAARWQTQLAVLTVENGGGTTRETQARAEEYLYSHGIAADYVLATGPVGGAVLDQAAAWRADLVIMGGYGFSPVWEVMLGSAVDQVLRTSRVPTLICR